MANVAWWVLLVCLLGCTCGTQKFPGPESNLSHCGDHATNFMARLRENSWLGGFSEELFVFGKEHLSRCRGDWPFGLPSHPCYLSESEEISVGSRAGVSRLLLESVCHGLLISRGSILDGSAPWKLKVSPQPLFTHTHPTRAHTHMHHLSKS